MLPFLRHFLSHTRRLSIVQRFLLVFGMMGLAVVVLAGAFLGVAQAQRSTIALSPLHLAVQLIQSITNTPTPTYTPAPVSKKVPEKIQAPVNKPVPTQPTVPVKTPASVPTAVPTQAPAPVSQSASAAISVSVTAYALEGKMADGNWTHYGACAVYTGQIPFGTLINLYDQNGAFIRQCVAEDTGGAIGYGHIDLAFPGDENAAIQWGRQYLYARVVRWGW